MIFVSILGSYLFAHAMYGDAVYEKNLRYNTCPTKVFSICPKQDTATRRFQNKTTNKETRLLNPLAPTLTLIQEERRRFKCVNVECGVSIPCGDESSVSSILLIGQSSGET